MGTYTCRRLHVADAQLQACCVLHTHAFNAQSPNLCLLANETTTAYERGQPAKLSSLALSEKLRHVKGRDDAAWVDKSVCVDEKAYDDGSAH